MKTLEHQLLVNCVISVDLKATTAQFLSPCLDNLRLTYQRTWNLRLTYQPIRKASLFFRGRREKRPGLCWALFEPADSRLGENSSSSEECISQAGCPSRTVNLLSKGGESFCWKLVQSTEDPALQSTICQDNWQLRREDNFEIETVDR